MKIPAHATCVFKGVIFDVYQWEQEMFDGSKSTFEALKRPDTVMVIAMQGDQVFYAEQEQPGKAPFISLFGGRAEEGETPLEAAKRELLEETGFASEDWVELRRVSFPGKIDWDVYYFVARGCSKVSEQKLDAGEKIEIHSISLDRFISEIIPGDLFREYELKQEILSSFNPIIAEQLKKDILGE
ncbi:MAG: hypothetical protein JWM96_305 [Alphaproteobacteria bacterium]|nr:hypothetical protein [Alphaproteobacteria bacterium]